MNPDSTAAIIINDLDNLAIRIEALPAHPRYTDALSSVQAARLAIIQGRDGLHQTAIREQLVKTETGE